MVGAQLLGVVGMPGSGLNTVHFAPVIARLTRNPWMPDRDIHTMK